MNILYFHTNTILSSWTIWNGAKVIRSLGHLAFDAAIPTDITGAVLKQVTPQKFRRIQAQLPTRDDLKQCDAMIVYGPEYVWRWLRELYGLFWHELPKNTIGLFLESTGTSSVRLPIERNCKHYKIRYFPDLADAKRLDGFWASPHIDTDWFYPDERVPKKFGAGFVGSLYPSRVPLIMKLSELLSEPLTVGDVHCHDVLGERHDLWTSLYIENIRQLRIHLSLPSNNPMLVSRPFETLGCGTFLLESRELPDPLRDGVHYRRYDPTNVRELANLIEYYLAHDGERQEIAAGGCQILQTRFSSRQFWADLLDPSERF